MKYSICYLDRKRAMWFTRKHYGGGEVLTFARKRDAHVARTHLAKLWPGECFHVEPAPGCAAGHLADSVSHYANLHKIGETAY